MLKNICTKERTLIIAIFIIFIFLRIFSDSPYYFIQGSDHARYLELANNFPYHTLYNNQLYLAHLPLFPYVIHVFTWFFQDHIAGIIVSLLSAIITFFIIYKLVTLLTKERYIAIGVLVLYSLSQIHIGSAINVMKESLLVMLTLASIYFYILYLKQSNKIDLWLSAISGFLLGITTDFVILLILGLIAILFIYGKESYRLKAYIPIVSTIISYFLWVFIRLYTYSTYKFYPASWDGTIVKVSEFGIMSLISTNNFREIATYLPNALPLGISFDFFHYVYPMIYMLTLVIAPWPSGLRFSDMTILFSMKYLLQLVVYTLLSIGGIYGLYKIGKQILAKRIKKNGMLLVLILFVIFLLPLMQEVTSMRFQVQAIIFLFIIINYGFFQLAKTFKFLRLFKVFIAVIILILILYLPFYYLENNNFVLSQEKVVEATKTAKFINQLPGEGVMAQIGYNQELAYLTNKRVMALPIHPDYMFLIDMYNISYLIYGGFYMKPFSEENKDKVITYYTIKHIREHPEKFKLLEVMEEYYLPKDKTDHIYIYEVIKN